MEDKELHGHKTLLPALAVITASIGIFAAAWLLASKAKARRAQGSIEFLFNQCDKSAKKLERSRRIAS